MNKNNRLWSRWRIREEADAVPRKKNFFFERLCLKFQYVLDVVAQCGKPTALGTPFFLLDVVAGEQVSVTLL